ncbi:hypothetical protein D3C72_1481930 [compost metagenome]
MDIDVSYRIVKTLIDDMMGRYRVDAVIGGVPDDRDGINIQVDMYEHWRYLISKELVKNGLLQEEYTRKPLKEIENMSFKDILDLRELYLKGMGYGDECEDK